METAIGAHHNVLWGRSRATPVTAVVLVVWVESGFPDRLPARRLSLSLCTLRLATGSIHLSSTTRDPAHGSTALRLTAPRERGPVSAWLRPRSSSPPAPDRPGSRHGSVRFTICFLWGAAAEAAAQPARYPTTRFGTRDAPRPCSRAAPGSGPAGALRPRPPRHSGAPRCMQAGCAQQHA